MRKRFVVARAVIILNAIMLCCLKAQAATQAVAPSDYLILQSIGDYHNSGKGRCGDGTGFLGAADHFGEDHSDTTCRTGYYNMTQDLAMSIQVTRHADSNDSLRWLMHEVEKGFRDADDEDNRLGRPHKGSRIVEISGSKIFRYWSTYRWISNNTVIVIDYGDPRKSEPVEVVQAYINKFPSTIASTFVFDSATDAKWIKDEMDRRLWLCDKWFMQLQLRKIEEKQVYQESVKSMNIFLDYREKYYRIKAADEKNLLAGYLSTNNGTGIKAKLAEYKNWWAVNKGGSITLP